MPSMTGLRERSRGDRVADRRSAEDERAEIEKAQGEFRDFVAGWTARHPGDRKAVKSRDDFLADYFFERHCAAVDREYGL